MRGGNRGLAFSRLRGRTIIRRVSNTTFYQLRLKVASGSVLLPVECRAANRTSVALTRGVVCATSFVSTSESCPSINIVHALTRGDLSRTVVCSVGCAIGGLLLSAQLIRPSALGYCGCLLRDGVGR